MKIIPLQYLRGLAALLVVIAHNSSLLEGNWSKNIPGALGVDVFFVLSGFIMTFITHQSAENPLSFIIKRFFRIWPVFFIVWLISFIFVSPDKTVSEMTCALHFCLQDYSRPGPTFGYSTLGPPWTLSYEAMFYMVFAVSMSINYRYRSYICALFFLISSIGFQLYYNGSFDPSSQSSPNVEVIHWWQALIKLTSNTITLEFIIGMMLAELTVMKKLPILTRAERATLLLLLILTVLYGALSGPQVFGISGGFLLASTLMLLTIMLGYSGITSNNFTLTYLGDVSYSLYLIHYPLMVFITRKIPDDASTPERLAAFTLSVIGSILIAAAMFKWIEKPSMRMGKKAATLLPTQLKFFTG
jgi:peptidoglycan/LPS O-acetylase OafA/YrhL